MSAEVEFQRAIYTALSPLSGFSVYDIAPQAADGQSLAAFPYVTFGARTLTEWDTQSEKGFDALIRLHTWSRTGSNLECLTIQGQIYAALHLQSLPITAHNTVLVRRESTNILPEGDGQVHGVCEYRILFEAT